MPSHGYTRTTRQPSYRQRQAAQAAKNAASWAAIQAAANARVGRT